MPAPRKKKRTPPTPHQQHPPKPRPPPQRPPHTVAITRAPAFLRFNPYIRKGYRSTLDLTQCLYSILWCHNETVNIWTHVFGFGVFVCLFVYDAVVVFGQLRGTHHDALVVTFVLLSFMLCMLLSSLYHTFNCHSQETYTRWLTYDIFGISTSFLAIFLSGLYYGFWCPETIGVRYIYVILVCGLFVAAMIFLLTPRLLGSEWDLIRVGLFTGWAISGLLPTFHWVYLHGGLEANIVKVFLPRILVMYAISLTAVVIYLLKIPERFYPGRFDIVGASHQLWHLVVLIALVYWHQTGIEYANYRLMYGCM
ncbi:hypothetical protein Pmani_037218 [Petrolisthes manimaculis]|uniref:Progestin and adipoQ receptor family member 3 n=1 Tax=Petrolisthes manimaculis TaxID=1843537 RepID=A0AAE1NGQ5_9EUCA|nr:hypothetical protein Pmani_037218 [Petrolisthes manimaculis]